MGFSDIPADTDAERILKAQDIMNARQDDIVDALNGLGMNLQWLVDNVKGLFEMFGNPQFMSMLPNMLNVDGMKTAAQKMEGNTDV